MKPGFSVAESELVEFLRSNLAHYKCPRSITFCETLPKTATGKVLRSGRVLTGDIGRRYFPRGRYSCLASYDIPASVALEGRELLRTSVWRR